MQKSTVIQDLCSDILYHPGILCPEIRDHLCISSGLIENDITDRKNEIRNVWL